MAAGLRAGQEVLLPGMPQRSPLLERLSRRSPLIVPALVFALPLCGAVALALVRALDAEAWSRLWHDTQTAPALGLSLWVGLASTMLTFTLVLWLVAHLHGTRWWLRMQQGLGSLLAVPHAAFAIGLALLLMPSGLVARLLAPLAGWDFPPDVATVQDRWGLALIIGLVLKEVPFLLWNVVAQLQRVGQEREIERQLQTAASMGYTSRSTWWRVLWPQLLPRLLLPSLAVWAYSLTVVDMALVLGPTLPPTLAVLAWQWLRDADEAIGRQGAAAALLLTLVVAAGALAAWALVRLLEPVLAHRWSRGDRRGSDSGSAPARLTLLAMPGTYALVLGLLAYVSVAAVWTFPELSPQVWSADAWVIVAHSGSTVWLTALLAVCSAVLGLVVAVAWMEGSPAHWDHRAAPLVFAPMLLPGVLLVVGLYRLMLELRLDASLPGLWLAHGLFTAPYVLVALAPAYRAYDARYEQTAQALGHGRAAFLWHVKWPMLLVPMAAAAAIGFAVSVLQYLPTQFVGAGRFATVTTEALTLASGGQRTLTAAFALLQGLMPAVVFGSALWLGRRQARRLGV
jgi:putative thiamine transport system permease protein